MFDMQALKFIEQRSIATEFGFLEMSLGKISGVGQAKLLRYGEAFLQVVGEKKLGSSLGVVATHKNGTRKSCALDPVFADQPPCL